MMFPVCAAARLSAHPRAILLHKPNQSEFFAVKVLSLAKFRTCMKAREREGEPRDGIAPSRPWAEFPMWQVRSYSDLS